MHLLHLAPDAVQTASRAFGRLALDAPAQAPAPDRPVHLAEAIHRFHQRARRVEASVVEDDRRFAIGLARAVERFEGVDRNLAAAGSGAAEAAVAIAVGAEVGFGAGR
ncbi:hypothetical protein [Leifsonia sp. fls2-241-R2A-40a]|uniref:hypothetical protein n=1 Tax=Leifsonia sp. fls2-241-R2A-40a TaxID=3040290 RepID=UPI00254E2C8C|nr:hypothetical protein [Leifsonia sp. fls2-241-R2A-40a]